MNNLSELLGEEWAEQLKDEFSKEYMGKLSGFIKCRRELNTVYPSSQYVFNAYKSLPFSKVRVCILGQDPYINPNEAHGLAFSTVTGKGTPTLTQLERSIEKDCYGGLNLSWGNNLERWVKQGVLLLNTVLTVDEGVSCSHFGKGWETFTSETIKKLSDRGDVIFLLWGNYAKAYAYLIDTSKNKILFATHPVSASYKGEIWDSKDCFNKVNEMIKGDKIIW